jgi:UDP-N-acetylmuramoyl-L-alanyl-D-glutamate--2,6-diaminopimelate ligase
MAIIEMILRGVREVPGGTGRCRVEPDRAAAISGAVGEARAGDTLLIAGKGHEKVQILADRVVPFDDVEVARRLIEERLGARRGGAGGETG